MLQENLRRFLSKSQQLDMAFNGVSTASLGLSTLIQDSAKEMLVVRLQDFWSQFVRELIVLSASGQAETSSGTPLPATMGFTGVGDVRTWLVANRPSRNRDLDWHVAATSTHWSQRIGIANHSTVTAAIGSTNSPEEQVRIYRNFIVHRTKETADRLRRENHRRGLSPSSLAMLPSETMSGGIPLFTRWVLDFQLVAKVASA